MNIIIHIGNFLNDCVYYHETMKNILFREVKDRK